MCVQKLIRDNITENPETGEYEITQNRTEEEFQKVVKRQSTFLYYAWGIWITSSAMRNILYIADECIPCPEENALYIDTDSCYSLEFHEDKIKEYNQQCIEKLKGLGDTGIEKNGKTYYPGVCELDGEYTAFVSAGAKRYCCKNPDGTLKLTISGVPKKKGAECLKGDIYKFKRGFIFRGEETGKLTHMYNYAEIHENEYGDEIADSINLVPCDYLLDESIIQQLEDMEVEEVSIQVYEEE